MTKTIVISGANSCFVELIHRDSDPAVWVVKRSAKFLWFRKRISSHWFNDERQAQAFAEEIKISSQKK